MAFSIAYRILRQRDDAEDALQKFAAQVWRIGQGQVAVSPNLNSDEARTRYLMGIIRNIACRIYRKRGLASASVPEETIADDQRANPRASSVVQSVKGEYLTREVFRFLEILVAAEKADSDKGQALARRLEKFATADKDEAEPGKTIRRAVNDLDKRTWRFRVVTNVYRDELTLKVIAEQIAKATGRRDITTSWVDHLRTDTIHIVRDVAFATGADLWMMGYPEIEDD